MGKKHKNYVRRPDEVGILINEAESRTLLKFLGFSIVGLKILIAICAALLQLEGALSKIVGGGAGFMFLILWVAQVKAFIALKSLIKNCSGIRISRNSITRENGDEFRFGCYFIDSQRRTVAVFQPENLTKPPRFLSWPWSFHRQSGPLFIIPLTPLLNSRDILDVIERSAVKRDLRAFKR